MCGIAGIVYPKAEIYKPNLLKMVSSIAHRGPDAEGIALFKKCLLGHTRLSIIDIKNALQPMYSIDKKVSITFNGEIYGYQNINKAINYPFKTKSDTETILALYKNKNRDLLTDLPGMFSFAIWNDEEESLFCARDRFGEKPLFYAIGDKGEFIFASEIKSIIASGLISPSLDINSIAHYLQKLYVHPTRTIYSNIFALPPAHTLYFRNNKIEINRYWSLPKNSNPIDLENAIEKFKDMFDNAISNQLIADVSVGAFLSGGLDSSTIVAAASKYNKGLKTFSFDFINNSKDKKYARMVSRMYDTNHIELSDNDFSIEELIFKMQDIYDEPFADSSSIPTYLLSKLASEHIKVILTGDGGDELFGGYPYWYNNLLYMDKYRKKSFLKKGIITSFIKLISRSNFKLPEHWINNYNAIERLKKYKSIEKFHDIQKEHFSLFDLESFGIDINEKTLPNYNNKDKIDDVLKNDCIDYLPGDILVKTDRASMANGLELRSPFLDYKFASFCISLPHSLKLNGIKDKIILRNAYEKYWPSEVCFRKKQGFGAPIKYWLKQKEMKDIKIEYLDDRNKKIFSYLDYNYAKKFSNKDNYQTWILLVLSLWLENTGKDRLHK
mgnify:CR=1 FL=1